MSYPHVPAAQIAAGLPARSAPDTSRKGLRATPLTRRFEVAGLTREGRIAEFSLVAPATTAFEATSAAFAHGTLIATENGPVAVQDLEPGMMIETADAGPKMLLWVGSMMLFPDLPGLNEDNTRLTRITAEAFGLSRPMSDLMLGPHARLLQRHPAMAARFGAKAAFVPVQTVEDGHSAVSIRPVSPVRVYHLALHGQHILWANGIETESFHPGRLADVHMDRPTWDLFLTLFPYARCLHDFGPITHLRLEPTDVDRLRVA